MVRLMNKGISYGWSLFASDLICKTINIASPFSFASATQRGRCGYGGAANTVRNWEMEGGGR